MKESREFPWKISPETRESVIQHLIDNGFIKVNGDIFILKGKALELLEVEPSKEVTTLSTCESWIDDWINLWPKGVKSGGRPVRAGKSSIVKKMNTFLANKKYNTQDIIDCTKAYISNLEASGYKYITCADYFISKSGSSLLEALLDEFDREKFEQESNGEGHFHKLL